jgi:multidrug efflux pump subunit AcrA (membrane-fusion protein)
MAQAVAGRPAGQKYFSVVVRLNEHNALLRPGMSAQLRVLTYARTAAILVPRTAVWWEGDVPWCTRLGPGGPERVRLALGMADDMRFEVLAGLKAGDSVALP